MKQSLNAYEEVLFLKGLQKKEPQAFQCLFDRYGKAIYFILLLILQDQTEAENTQKEVFTTAYKEIDNYNPENGSLWFWLLTITTPKICRSKEHILFIFRKITNQL